MPSSGLVDAAGVPKPAMKTLLELRRDFIG
jgi:hypothetical protein